MTRRSFITSTLQALALVGAVKLGLGNMTAEDVRITRGAGNTGELVELMRAWNDYRDAAIKSVLTYARY